MFMLFCACNVVAIASGVGLWQAVAGGTLTMLHCGMMSGALSMTILFFCSLPWLVLALAAGQLECLVSVVAQVLLCHRYHLSTVSRRCVEAMLATCSWQLNSSSSSVTTAVGPQVGVEWCWCMVCEHARFQHRLE